MHKICSWRSQYAGEYRSTTDDREWLIKILYKRKGESQSCDCRYIHIDGETEEREKREREKRREREREREKGSYGPQAFQRT